MSYLSRDAASLPEELWENIDSEVVQSAKKVLTGRRFLHVFGPLGIGAQSINIDKCGETEEAEEDGLIITRGRSFAEIPIIYEDFTLLAKDMEMNENTGYPLDLSKASAAGERCALKEDRLIYFGNGRLGYTGLLTAPGAAKIEKKDWGTGENAFSDVAAGIELLISKNIYGTAALAVSPDLYMNMQRIQPGTGLLEIDRVKKLLDGRVYKTPVLGRGRAVLVCPEPRNMDIVIGQDMAAAYLEQTNLNHSFRVLESVLLRIKRDEAIVIFE